MDGVLFLSTDCHEEAFRFALGQKDAEDFSYQEIAGMRTDEAFRFLYTKKQIVFDERLIKEKVDAKRQKALALLHERGQVALGTRVLLEKLSQEYQLALASSASPQTVELFLSMSETRHCFQCILDGSMVSRAKPAPDIYDLAVERLGVLPGECVVVEDALKGAEAATRAGIPLIIVTSQKQTGQFLHFKPLMVVSEVREVERILL